MKTRAPRVERFESLLAEHRGIVQKVANTYAFHAEDRRDLAQEIGVQLWRAFPGYDEDRPFATWAYRIALNVGISFARRQRPDPISLNAAKATEAPVGEADDKVVVLRACIDRLDPLSRALLLLYLDERTYREIAETLGITETNVATKINRLKQQLRGELGGTDGETNGTR